MLKGNRLRGISTACGMLLLSAATGAYAKSRRADLVISSIVPSATEAPKVFVIIRNDGEDGVRDSFDVELWLDEQQLGRQRVGEGLKPEDSLRVSFERPERIEQGLHNFIARVDSGNEVSELREDNNEESLSVWSKGFEERAANQ